MDLYYLEYDNGEGFDEKVHEFVGVCDSYDKATELAHTYLKERDVIWCPDQQVAIYEVALNQVADARPVRVVYK